MEKTTGEKVRGEFARSTMIGAAPLFMFVALILLPEHAFAVSLTKQLDLGMSGSDVTLLQQFYAMDSAIYPEGLITGYYGAKTAAATSRFQEKNGLPGVGRVGPQTLALINAQLGGSGITGGKNAQTSSGDNSGAPILLPPTIRIAPNSATFVWTTTKPANARVLYGSAWPFLLSSAPVFTATGGLSTYQSVTVTGLLPNKTYAAVLQSTDASGNMNMTLGIPFSTPAATATPSSVMSTTTTTAAAMSSGY